MKKFNKNSLLFVFVIVFVAVGIWGKCFSSLKHYTIECVYGLLHGNISSFFDYKYYVDDISNKELSYHDTMMDINSIKNNLLGTKVIEKDDVVVVKSDSGSLAEPTKGLRDIEIEEIALKIEELKNIVEKNKASFLYCIAPTKGLYESLPENVENAYVNNHNSFISKLKSHGVPTLDLSVALKENGVKDSDVFYYTDHHWTATSGFMATKAICEKLNKCYEFDYTQSLIDMNNYNIKVYPDWFLGSKGKKVGAFFTWHGADDFELITPRFETDLTEMQPFKNQVRSGSFEETVLYKNNLEKDYYKINTYATYSGGDFRLQIVKNNLNPNGKKVLLIRDSFACVVSPFLSLQTSELHICDVRNGDYYVGDKLNIETYIQEINPDYVIVLYSGVSAPDSENGRYEFY